MTARFGKEGQHHEEFWHRKIVRRTKGYGIIKPEAGGDELRFEKSAVQWGTATTPKTERRLSYELGKNGSGDACAINLHSA